MKKWITHIFLCIVFALIVVLAPIIVNELYKLNNGYLTLWDAGDMLSYIATIISAAATFFISWIAITQSKKANKISDRLLKLEEINSVPSLCIIEEKTTFVEYNENSVQFKICVKNISNGIIDIKRVSDLNIHVITSDVSEVFRFIDNGLEFQTLLPGQQKQLDFHINKHDKKIGICNPDFIRKLECKLYFDEAFEMVLGYKDALTEYKETVKLNGYCIFSISNNISIHDQKITRSDYRLEKHAN